MGFLTTFTVYNDGCDQILKEPEQFAQKVYEGCRDLEEKDFGVGNHCNLVHVQRARHADDHTIYVHMGNCVTEVNPFSREFESLIERCPEFAEKLVKFIEQDAKRLRKVLKDKTAKANP